ncbi:MAG TPA: selenide, water dikinase SelD [Stellaceae bacterium]|nr:selenide, water dikinase SelD [Stellaceae bacterium]
MQPRIPISQDLVLVGGGHAHVHVLKSLGMRPAPGVRTTLITRDVETPYSGMLPGYVAGHYDFAECHIDLMRLARFAGARLIHDEAIGLDRAQRRVMCRGHPPIRYDFASLDIGSTPRLDDVPGAAEHTVAVKPIDRFGQRWEALLARARPGMRLAVVGGGAGGVELALSAHHRLGMATVTLVTRDALLPSHNAGVGRRFSRLMAARGIGVVTADQVIRVEPGRLVLASGAAVDFDEALWVTEAAAAPWLTETNLPLDPGGFVVTDEMQRSPADPRVFAVGDVCTMQRHPRQKAGVYAVRAGPKLADNLRRALAGREPKRAVLQRRGLALIGTGDANAVASRGPFVATGPALWRLKQWIDRRWMRKYVDLPEMEGDEDAMRCGGCAAKVPADVLSRALARLGPQTGAAVSVGAGSDDAALVTIPGAPPLLQTVDFFRALVDDPYLFGRIAANHALGDIYAMGGLPDTALAIVTLPPARPPITEHDLFHLLKGATEVFESAGAVLVGGHSAEGAEMGLGFAVTGRPGATILRKGGLNPGDRLILTKPLGTGVILAAEMRGKAPARIVAGAIDAMLQSAAIAAAVLAEHEATACTDVTGFGLLGHLGEMLAASEADSRLEPAAIPALDGALALFEQGLESSLHASNLFALVSLADADPNSPLVKLLIDPQTAGGLLAGVPAERAGQCVAELRRRGYRAAAVGLVERQDGARPRIRLDTGCLAEMPRLRVPAQ